MCWPIRKSISADGDWAAAAAAPYVHSRMNTINPEAQQTEHRVTSINIISVPSGMYVDPDAPDRFLTKELDARRRRSSPVTPTRTWSPAIRRAGTTTSPPTIAVPIGEGVVRTVCGSAVKKSMTDLVRGGRTDSAEFRLPARPRSLRRLLRLRWIAGLHRRASRNLCR